MSQEGSCECLRLYLGVKVRGRDCAEPGFGVDGYVGTCSPLPPCLLLWSSSMWEQCGIRQLRQSLRLQEGTRCYYIPCPIHHRGSWESPAGAGRGVMEGKGVVQSPERSKDLCSMREGLLLSHPSTKDPTGLGNQRGKLGGGAVLR